MTRFRLMLFALSCTVIFMVIVLAIITFSKSDPVVVAAPVLAANPEKFSGQEIEIYGLWCHYLNLLYYCKGPDPECPMRPLSEAEKDRFAKNVHCRSTTSCPGLPMLTPDDRKYESCIRSSPPRLVVILKDLALGENRITVVNPGCETRDPSCLVDMQFFVSPGGYSVHPGEPTIVTTSSGRLVSR